MKYTVDSGLFDYNWLNLSVNVIRACVQLVLYGVYIVLFILAVYTLAHPKTAGKKLLLGYTWAMAVFGTVQLVLSLVEPWIGARFVEVLVKQDVTGNFTSQPELVKLALLSRSLGIAQAIIFGINTLVTDSLLLYRCFVIWGSDWRPVVLPGVLMTCTFIIGFFASIGFGGLIVVPAILFRLPYVFGALTNLVLVVLIGGRIWYIRQDARLVAGDGLRKRYDTVIVMAIFGSDSGGVIFGILVSIAIHTLNIVPTLIIVRVGLGQNIEDAGKTPPTKEARDTRRKPRADFSAHRKMSPLLPVLYIKASEDTLTA